MWRLLLPLSTVLAIGARDQVEAWGVLDRDASVMQELQVAA